MSRLAIATAERSSSCNSNHKDTRWQPLVGLDIVTFEDFNPCLYQSTREFLQVFQSSFTNWEWNCILAVYENGDGHMLREFYLRWAVKEAYTKALGVGMGCSFDSFETRMHLDADAGAAMQDGDGIYSYFLAHKNDAGQAQSEHDIEHRRQSCNVEAIQLSGSVILNPASPQLSSKGDCTFYLLPLWENDVFTGRENDTARRRALDQAKGCACICLVHAPSRNETSNNSDRDNPVGTNRFHLTVEWQSLEDLLSWHYQDYEWRTSSTKDVVP